MHALEDNDDGGNILSVPNYTFFFFFILEYKYKSCQQEQNLKYLLRFWKDLYVYFQILEKSPNVRDF